MKLMLALFFTLMATTSFAGIKTAVDCRGLDEVVVARDKYNNTFNGAYICSKILEKQPVAIIKDENGNNQFDKDDTISYFISKNFTHYKEILSKIVDHFNEELTHYYESTGKDSTYYQIYVSDLIEMSEATASSEIASNDNYDEFEDLYRQRYYDPEEGRFLSPDPKGFAGGDTNLYRYVENNPISYVDPTGTDKALAQELLFHTTVVVDDPNRQGGKVYIDFKPADSVTAADLAYAIITGSNVPGQIDIRRSVIPGTFEIPGTNIKQSSELDAWDIQRARELQNDPNLQYSLTGSGNSCVGFAAGF